MTGNVSVIQRSGQQPPEFGQTLTCPTKRLPTRRAHSEYCFLSIVFPAFFKSIRPLSDPIRLCQAQSWPLSRCVLDPLKCWFVHDPYGPGRVETWRVFYVSNIKQFLVSCSTSKWSIHPHNNFSWKFQTNTRKSKPCKDKILHYTYIVKKGCAIPGNNKSCQAWSAPSTEWWDNTKFWTYRTNKSKNCPS